MIAVAPAQSAAITTDGGADAPQVLGSASDELAAGSCNFLDELPGVRAAVVAVLASSGEQPVSQGTAFHTGGGRYVTAAHVVLDDDGRPFNDIALVLAPDGRVIPATIDVAGESSNERLLRDVAVLLADPIEGSVSARAASDDDVGRSVRALGYAVSQYGFSGGAFPQALVSPGSVVTVGQESGVDFMQADNHVEPGMSGGPLVDECGNAIAVASGLPKWVSDDLEGVSAFAVFISVSEIENLE